jgi:hypothetical protein
MPVVRRCLMLFVRADCDYICPRETLTAPALVAEGEKSRRYIDDPDAVATRKNARDVVSHISPQERKRVQDILAKAR